MLDLDADELAQAYTTLIRARIACAAGRLAEALTLYEAILGSLRVAESTGYQGQPLMRDADLTRRAARPRTAAAPRSTPGRD